MMVRKFGARVGKILVTGALAAGVALTACANANAATVHFYQGNPVGFQSDLLTFLGSNDENVLLNDPMVSVDGNPVIGKTNVTNTLVSLLGDVNLHPMGGQSRLGAQNPPNATFTDLLVSLVAPNTTFKSLAFEVNPPQVGGRPELLGTDTINLVGTNLDQNSTTVDIFSNGLTFFGVIVEGDGSLDSVSLFGNVNIEDIRQIRIGGFGEKDDTNPEPTPEPASMALLAMGALPLI
jgi:hypothetical protein